MQSNSKSRLFSAEAHVAAFPLGGIGAGNVSLGARGDLRDWEIFNHSSKGTLFPNTFFAIWARTGEQPPFCRVLEGPIQPPHTLSHGYHPITGSGLPRFRNTAFRGEYPFATIDFDDPDFPLGIQLEAFTPLIPLDASESGLPCAILTYIVTNRTPAPISMTIVGSLMNAVGGIDSDLYGNLATPGAGQNVNEYREEQALRGLYFGSERYTRTDRAYGNLSLATTYPQVTVKRAWVRGAWYDFLQEFWSDLSDDGKLTDLNYDTPSPEGKSDTGSLGLVDTLAPGQRGTYPFILTWFFPNRAKSWKQTSPATTQNHYATQFDSSWAVARHVVEQMKPLEETTRTFHAALFDSTLPAPVIDALSANIVPVRSNTCFWLEDGNFYAYEGCFDSAGCCDGNCTHVWSYAQTAAYLFPALERNMRQTEFAVETEDSGYMSFRTYKPFNEQFVWQWANQKPEAAVDGQMGSILRALREWQVSGDLDWLKTIWPGVKRAIDFAGAQWDRDRDGVLDGRQHNTYDIEFYGPNPLCSIYYLAGLRATEELAKVMGEPDFATKCHALFERSSQRADQLLWNGEYYVQKIDDVNEHKYQHGAGCLSDQLLGQLYARLLDLGDLLPADHIKASLRAIFLNNFKRSFHDHVNCQRTYVLNDEAGLVLCTWPHGGKPALPFVYSDEVWTGIEYQVAAHLIYEGWLDDGLEIVQAVQARHDGVRRNPWDEVECGHHYARSMSSWALLLALSGFHYRASAAFLAFAPAINADNFQCFFSTGAGWGSYAQQMNDENMSASLNLQYGKLSVACLELAAATVPSSVTVRIGDRVIQARLESAGPKTSIVFDPQVALEAGQTLEVQLM